MAVAARDQVVGLRGAGTATCASRTRRTASALRDKGMIDYRRGVLTIRNATKLRRAACECVDEISRSSNGHGRKP